MSIVLTVNGQTYDYPETTDQGWGADATDWAQAVTLGMLQKAGGLFQLLAEVDFGTSYGLKSLYYKSRTSNPADAGQIRLARVDVISWRNEANSANLDLSVNSSNALLFNGTAIQGSISVSDTATIDLTFAADTLSADVKSNSITNTMINSAAAISFSKLASMTAGNILMGNGSTVATSTAVSGDITINSSGVTAIGANKVTNAMLAQVATATFKGRTTASTGNVEDLTATQATALLNSLVGDSGAGGTKGLAPAPAAGDAAAGKFLKADGTWTAPPGAGDVVGPASSTDDGFALFSGTSGKLLKNSAAVVPVTKGGTGLSSTTINQILYSSANNTIAGLATGNTGALVTSSSGVPSITTAATAGNVMQRSGTSIIFTSLDLTAAGTVGSSILGVANGGTGAASLTDNRLLLGNGTAAVGVLAAGTSGQHLQSQGASDPAWTTATFPATATGTGKVLRADGTNWVASTATYPDTATSTGKILRADGTNWSATTATFPDTASTNGGYLRSDGTNWIQSTLTLPNTAAANGIMYASATNGIATATNLTHNGTRTYMNTTTTRNGGILSIDYNGSSQAGIGINDTASASGSALISFLSGGSLLGSITHNNVNITYGGTSDYRLKENIQPITDALSKVMRLKPCTYKWKKNGALGQGFIAHELQEVIPDAVVGGKDAVNEDGSIKAQQIDPRLIVATLAAAIQELKAEIEDLKSQIKIKDKDKK